MTLDARPDPQPVDDLDISQAIRDAGAKTHEVLPGTPGGHLAEIAARFPDRPAIEGEGLVLDYAGLDARVNRTARLLTARGLGRGDRMAVLAENRLDYVVLAFAAARFMAVPNPGLSPSRISEAFGQAATNRSIQACSPGGLPLSTRMISVMSASPFRA